MNQEFLDLLDKGLKEDPEKILKGETFNTLVDAYRTPKWVKINEILRKHRIINVVTPIVKKEFHKRNNVAEINPDGEKKEELIYKILKGYPIENKLAEVPPGWILRDYIPGSQAAIERIYSKANMIGEPVTYRRDVLPVPVIVSEVMYSINDNSVFLKIAHKDKDGWHETVAPQHHIFDAQHIIGTLGAKGLPITSNNRKDVIDYISCYKNHNGFYIKAPFVSNKFGWIGTKMDSKFYGFLCGKDFVVNQKNSQHNKKKIIDFLGGSKNEAMHGEKICSKGTCDEWYDAVASINKYPRLEIALYASLCAPLLEVFNLPSFIIDWSAGTGEGKSSAMILGASVWGLGDVNNAYSIIESWNLTMAGIENLASVMNGIPVFLDDTKNHRKIFGKSIIPDVIYMLCNGRGNLRSTRDGKVEPVKYWRTVILSNGEQAITDFGKDEGAAARVLSIWGNVLGRDHPNEQRFSDNLTENLKEHYGHVGPLFVKWIIDHSSEWPVWEKELKEITTKYREVLTEEHKTGVAARVSKLLAIIELTGRLAHKALNLPWTYFSPVDAKILSDVSHGADATNQSAEALQDILGWCLVNKNKFSGHGGYDKAGLCYGVWDISDDLVDNNWNKLYIVAKEVKNELNRQGYDSNSILRMWKADGVTECEERRTTKRVRLDGPQISCVCINRSAMENFT